MNIPRLNGYFTLPAVRGMDIEFQHADDIFVKIIRFDPLRASMASQHKHEYDHISVVLGPFRVWHGDEHGVSEDSPSDFVGDIGQPASIMIPAHKFHRFVSLRGGGMLLCISREHDGDGQQIEERAK